ncbi:hypothetical protein EsH8_XIV_000016 [Colletotrichum jinshuiense]
MEMRSSPSRQTVVIDRTSSDVHTENGILRCHQLQRFAAELQKRIDDQGDKAPRHYRKMTNSDSFKANLTFALQHFSITADDDDDAAEVPEEWFEEGNRTYIGHLSALTKFRNAYSKAGSLSNTASVPSREEAADAAVENSATVDDSRAPPAAASGRDSSAAAAAPIPASTRAINRALAPSYTARTTEAPGALRPGLLGAGASQTWSPVLSSQTPFLPFSGNVSAEPGQSQSHSQSHSQSPTIPGQYPSAFPERRRSGVQHLHAPPIDHGAASASFVSGQQPGRDDEDCAGCKCGGRDAGAGQSTRQQAPRTQPGAGQGEEDEDDDLRSERKRIARWYRLWYARHMRQSARGN